jgi:erythrose-4-phosphate dehydrogenase
MDTKKNLPIRVAINGYGRIGRSVLRALYESEHKKNIKIIAINELADCKTIAHLTKYDSTHGHFPGTIEIKGNKLEINKDNISIYQSKNINDLPWTALEIDVVFECSGAFTDRLTAYKHIKAGAKKVLFSQPGEPDLDATIVMGVNENTLNGKELIISNASCSTNCVVPVINTLNKEFTAEGGVITTIHSAMNDQPVIDAYHHTDLRKTRAAMNSIIPVDTQLAIGIDRMLPELAGRFEAQAMRVPTMNVSVIDLSILFKNDVNVLSVNKALEHASQSELSGIIGYTEEPLASCDFNHDKRSGIVDASQTRVSQKRLVKILIWFDNEWGYANRMLELTKHWLSAKK